MKEAHYCGLLVTPPTINLVPIDFVFKRLQRLQGNGGGHRKVGMVHETSLNTKRVWPAPTQ